MFSDVEFFFWHSTRQEDIKLLNDLLRRIMFYKWYKEIRVLSSGSIDAGEDSAQVLQNYLSSSRIVLPLISADFPWEEAELHSQLLMSRMRTEDVKIIPIKLRESSLHIFSSLSDILPLNGRAIDSWLKKDEALDDVARTLDIIVRGSVITGLLRGAQRHQRIGNDKEALERYNQVIELDPHSNVALKGKSEVEHALQEKAELKKLFFEQIEEYRVEHKYSEILEICQQMLPEYPEEAFSLDMYKGEAFEQLFEYQNALTIYEMARSINGQDVRVFIHMGDVFCQLKRYEEAAHQYQLAINLAPSDSTLSQKLVEALVICERFKEVLFECNRVIDRGLGTGQIYLHKGHAHGKLGEFKNAIPAYKQVILREESNVKAYLELGDAYFILGELSPALDAYTTALLYSPEDSDLWRKKGSTLIKLRSFNDAKKAYEQAVSFSPNNSYIRKEYADILAQLQLYEEAAFQCTTIISLMPEFAATYRLRAEVYRNLALQDLHKAEELERRERRRR